MKLRYILRILAFALLIEGLLSAIKHPVQFHVDAVAGISPSLATYALQYYSSYALWVSFALYVIFEIYICVLDTKFAHAHFGSYFRYDILVAIANVAVTFYQFDDVIGDFVTKIVMEFITAVTTLLAGYSIYSFFKTHAMEKVCWSYALLSLRHVVFGIILIVELVLNASGKVTIDEMSGVTAISTTWILLMPLLVTSRILLFWGIKDLAPKHSKPHKKLKEV